MKLVGTLVFFHRMDFQFVVHVIWQSHLYFVRISCIKFRWKLKFNDMSNIYIEGKWQNVWGNVSVVNIRGDIIRSEKQGFSWPAKMVQNGSFLQKGNCTKKLQFVQYFSRIVLLAYLFYYSFRVLLCTQVSIVFGNHILSFAWHTVSEMDWLILEMNTKGSLNNFYFE